MLDDVYLANTIARWAMSLHLRIDGLQQSQVQTQTQRQPQAQTQRQPQLLSNSAKQVLALRAARVTLQRWRGYLGVLHPPACAQGAAARSAAGGGRSQSVPRISGSPTAGGAAGGAAGAGGPGSSGTAAAASAGSAGAVAATQQPLAAKPAKPLTQKQLRQQAAAAAKQHQAAATKQAAAAAEQRREEKRREAAEAVAAARRGARLKAYRLGGITRDACSDLFINCLSYLQCADGYRWRAAANKDSERLASAATGQQARFLALLHSAPQPAPPPVPAMAEAAGAKAAVAPAVDVMQEEGWRVIIDCLRLLVDDADSLWSEDALVTGVLQAGELGWA